MIKRRDFLMLAPGVTELARQRAGLLSWQGTAGGRDGGVYDVRHYGALGGGADDSAAFVAAIRAAHAAGGGTVYVPPGSYTVGLAISSVSNVTILGEGAASVIVVKAGGWSFLGCARLVVDSLTFSQQDSQYTTVYLDRAAPGVTDAADSVGICRDCTVQDCRFTTTTSSGNRNVAAVGIHDAVNTLVLNNYIEYTHIAVISKYRQTVGSRIIGNHCVQHGTDRTAEGIKVDRGVNAVVRDNVIEMEDSHDGIIWNGDADAAVCLNNTILMSGTCSYGIVVGGSEAGAGPITSLRVAGNQILADKRSTPTAGIFCNQASPSQVVVTGNFLRNCPLYVVGGPSGVEVSSNTIVNVIPRAAGINIGLVDGVVVNNLVRGCHDGIQFWTSGPVATRVTVASNIVDDFARRGIVVTHCSDCLISGNRISSRRAVEYGIWAEDGNEAVDLATRIMDNAVELTHAATVGLRVEHCDGITAARNRLVAAKPFESVAVGASVSQDGYLIAGVAEAVLGTGVDASAGGVYGVTLTAPRLVGAPLNPTPGRRITFVFTQGGSGGCAVTWNAVFKVAWSDAGNTIAKVSSVSFICDGTNWNQDGGQAPYA